MQWLTHIINFRKKNLISIRCVLSAISRPIGLPCLLHYPYPSEILMSRARRGRSTICLQRAQDDCPKGSQWSHSILSVERPGGIRYCFGEIRHAHKLLQTVVAILGPRNGSQGHIVSKFSLSPKKQQSSVQGARLPSACWVRVDGELFGGG